LISKNLCLNPFSNSPIQQGHSSINGPGDTCARLFHHGTNVSQDAGLALDDLKFVGHRCF
jgi:hypothetical protein